MLLDVLNHEGCPEIPLRAYKRFANFGAAIRIISLELDVNECPHSEDIS